MSASENGEAPADGRPQPSEAVAQGRRLLQAWFTAWNRADPRALRELVHVPHVALPGPRLLLRDSEQELLRSPDFRALASMEGWHHSTLDELVVWQWSEDKVHCAVRFGRHAADGRRYADAEGVYVATWRDGRWAIQLNSATLRPIGLGGVDRAGAVAAAEDVVERWVYARDRADLAAARRLVHLPFVELDGPRLAVHRRLAERRRPAGVPAAAGAHRRVLRRTEVRERSAEKVTLEVEIERVGPGGAVAGRDASLAIVMEREGRWGLHVHSTFQRPCPPRTAIRVI